MTPESVFTEFALQTIGVVTNLQARSQTASLELTSHHREVRRAMILISCAGRHNQSLQLHSWVPDWTINLNARPLVFGLERRFAAGGDKLGTFDWDLDSGLLLCGKLLDTIASAGTVHLDQSSEKTQESDHKVIQSWWKEAQQMALDRIARSPGSTVNVDAFEAFRRDLLLCKHGYFSASGTKGRRNSLLNDVDPIDEALHNASDTLTLGPTRGRVFFTTSTGYIGLAPQGAREGDLIYVVMGAGTLQAQVELQDSSITICIDEKHE
jgi:hypothetical protein